MYINMIVHLVIWSVLSETLYHIRSLVLCRPGYHDDKHLRSEQNLNTVALKYSRARRLREEIFYSRNKVLFSGVG